MELLLTPALRIADLYARPDTEAGVIHVRATVVNSGKRASTARAAFSVAPATSCESIKTTIVEQATKVGETAIEAILRVPSFHRWDLANPFLYRVSVRVEAPSGGSFDERSVRCGFRDFRFERGHFRLNGRRLLLRCSHTGNHCPIGLQLPPDPDYLRRDLLNVKTMGFNAIRFIAGVATRQQLDLADELGLMVYEESYAGWLLGDSPQMKERFDRSVASMVRRDRNHPCVVMWGLLNETNDGPVFRHAVKDAAARA